MICHYIFQMSYASVIINLSKSIESTSASVKYKLQTLVNNNISIMAQQFNKCIIIMKDDNRGNGRRRREG